MPSRSRSLSGGVVVWKPLGITSRRALEVAERRLGTRPLGHSGTLDPMASGILILLGGEARKFQDLLMREPKEYHARFLLGMGSDSDDAEGPIWCRTPRPALPGRERIEEALEGFRGGYRQAPPRLSAVRIGGVRAHLLARQGRPSSPSPRAVQIHCIEILRWEPPLLELRVSCGAGTYLRALARDLGEVLSTDGYLAGLRRTAAGLRREDDAVPLGDLSRDHWLSPEELLSRAQRLELDRRSEWRLSRGQRVPFSSEPLAPRPSTPKGRLVAWCEGRVVGLVEVRGDLLYPCRWLSPSTVR